MISDYFEVDIEEETFVFDDIIENRNIWAATIEYNKNKNTLILVDNINLFVVLIDLFNNHKDVIIMA
jgi:hypothetical protein